MRSIFFAVSNDRFILFRRNVLHWCTPSADGVREVCMAGVNKATLALHWYDVGVCDPSDQLSAGLFVCTLLWSGCRHAEPTL